MAAPLHLVAMSRLERQELPLGLARWINIAYRTRIH
jgi:hypothetical protein